MRDKAKIIFEILERMILILISLIWSRYLHALRVPPEISFQDEEYGFNFVLLNGSMIYSTLALLPPSV
jgi:hypothetical protein